jgi:hypothetical protein
MDVQWVEHRVRNLPEFVFNSRSLAQYSNKQLTTEHKWVYTQPYQESLC